MDGRCTHRSTLERDAAVNRRQFLARSAGALVATTPFVIGYTLWVEPHWLEFVHRDLPIENLPAHLNGKTLAQLSDIHVGPQVSDAYLAESLQRLRALSPDIVVYTGDFLSYRPSRGDAQFQQLRDILTVAPRGTIATIGILGNHDYGVNWSQPEVAARIAQVLEQQDIQLLRNEVASLPGLDVIGVDDLWAHRADAGAAIAKRTQSAVIALCHNPDGLDSLDWTGYRGWVLAGHTHGGQCKPPFLPPPLLPVRNSRYTAGEIAVNEGRTLYISRGVGHLLKARFNVRPEITLFTLRRLEQNSLAAAG